MTIRPTKKLTLSFFIDGADEQELTNRIADVKDSIGRIMHTRTLWHRGLEWSEEST